MTPPYSSLFQGEERARGTALQTSSGCVCERKRGTFRRGLPPLGKGSDCLEGQAVCHGRLSLMIALRMTKSFRATAMRATIFGLPAATSRSKNARRTGLCRLATMAPMNRTVRTAVRPPPMKLLPRHCPDCRVNGARPTKAAICLMAELPELGQLSHECTRNGRSHSRHGGQQVFFGAPNRRALHCIVDLAIEAGQLLFQRGDKPADALLHPCQRDALFTLALGPDHLDNLPAPGHQIRQQPGGF